MQHPFDALKAEYVGWIANAEITRQDDVDAACERIIKLKPAYMDLQEKTGVPALWTMAINERESSSNMRTYLGNGQSLSHVTTLVPRGRGPFFDPGAWVKGAIDAFHVDCITDVPQPWTMPLAAFEDELWNGFGYRDYHGVPSPYVVAGTTIQKLGKYTGDGHWDGSAMDTQLGTLALMMGLVALDPSLAFDTGAETAPVLPVAPTPMHTAAPTGIAWVQHALNVVDHAGLDEDGSYGRLTKQAVRAFQVKFDVQPYDGWAGTLTNAALDAELAKVAS